MAISKLPTELKDDVLNESMDGKRRYQLTPNADGTYNLLDATTYEQLGSVLGSLQINTRNETINLVAEDLGDISGLSTASKESLVSAINEVFAKADTAQKNVGTLSSLATSVKSNLVAAINEVVSKAWYENTSPLDVGPNSRVRLSDQNGCGNIIIRPPTSYGNVYWVIDSSNSHLRMYYYNGSAVPTVVTIPKDAGYFNLRPPVVWSNGQTKNCTSGWTVLTSTWTAPRAGTAVCAARVGFDAMSQARRIAGIYVNNAEYACREVNYNDAGGGTQQSLSMVVPVSAGNTINLRGYHSRGSGEVHALTGVLHIMFFPS